MSEFDKGFYVMFTALARQQGLDSAVQQMTNLNILPADEIAAMREKYTTGIARVAGIGGPVMARAQESWYAGAQATDPSWSQFVKSMERENRGNQVQEVHLASDKIIGLTPNTKAGEGKRRGKGLVVGFVQSGKTTNFTAVAAKASDLDYRMVIVLAGIHNSLRRQTQTRLEEILSPEENRGRWQPITRRNQDFDLVRLDEEAKEEGSAFNAESLLNNPGKTLLVVVKKNHVVLRKLRDWLSTDAAQKQLQENHVLVIDDEADQASVETNTINPLIREILQLMPLSTYIGYTATPFANVFINPHVSDDLYPEDFIYPLPRPEGYFGPEKLFGRDVLDGGEDFDGYDMIREIPEEDEFLYRPRKRNEVSSFNPTMTPELREAVRWFCLATAARWNREHPDEFVNSSMLIHTSYQIEVHQSYEEMLKEEITQLSESVTSLDETVLDELREQWLRETAAVDSSIFGREIETFHEVLAQLPAVLKDVRVVIENSGSAERLDYKKKQDNTIVAVGGNTLSRGITLLGLVSSVFIRPSNTYDTLMQMGRWFGFREGYEELPRIWTTDQLRRSFRHLALVEQEMRSDMEVYERQSLTPREAAVRIRTHPTLRITAKMGAAVAAQTSFNGARLQIRDYEIDTETLEKNWNAGEALINAAKRRSTPEEVQSTHIVYRDVPVEPVLEFLDRYHVSSDQPDVDTDAIKRYIQGRLAADNPQMGLWNVAIRGGDREEKVTDFAGHEVRLVNRAPLKDSKSGRADIGTLMVPQDLVIDLDIPNSEARRLKESGMKEKRWESPEVKDKGLLVLYPIDRESTDTRKAGRRADMNSALHVLGVAIVFPRANYSESERTKKQTTHMHVDLGAVEANEVEVELAESPEQVDTSRELYKEAP
ncbi:Z1 domain-containing protein [Corynebacterium sp. CCUG 70398]|uniref:Z1 domain-containing protein n=1 Tax=Corynebacterium sp. CCUG 70398 TaxID=2823891 RepID=UPI00210C7ECB|nr:Z1 domain-containing protein [Corynebacterium sp. CCUG 70398]